MEYLYSLVITSTTCNGILHWKQAFNACIESRLSMPAVLMPKTLNQLPNKIRRSTLNITVKTCSILSMALHAVLYAVFLPQAFFCPVAMWSPVNCHQYQALLGVEIGVLKSGYLMKMPSSASASWIMGPSTRSWVSWEGMSETLVWISRRGTAPWVLELLQAFT